jgi:hypothetical protein
MDSRPPERESIWSVGRKLLPWYLGLVFALTIGWTAFIARAEVVSGRHESITETSVAVVRNSALAIPLIVTYSIIIITSADLLGGATMVTYRYLERKFLKPLIEKQRAEAERRQAEAMEQGREQGKEQGREQGREEERLIWTAWNRRRVEAEKKGEPFNEPPPSP